MELHNGVMSYADIVNALGLSSAAVARSCPARRPGVPHRPGDRFPAFSSSRVGAWALSETPLGLWPKALRKCLRLQASHP
jgi:hypothetical protein